MADYADTPQPQPMHRRPSAIASPESIKASKEYLRSGPRRYSRPESNEPRGEPVYYDRKQARRYFLKKSLRVHLPKYLVTAFTSLSESMAIVKSAFEFFAQLDRMDLDAGWPIRMTDPHLLPEESLPGADNDDETAITLCSPSPPASFISSAVPPSSPKIDVATQLVHGLAKLKLATSDISSSATNLTSETPPYTPEDNTVSTLPTSAQSSFGEPATDSGYHDTNTKGKNADVASEHNSSLDEGSLFSPRPTNSTSRPASPDGMIRLQLLMQDRHFNDPNEKHDTDLCVLPCCNPKPNSEAWWRAGASYDEDNLCKPHGKEFDQKAWDTFVAKYEYELDEFEENDLVRMRHDFHRVKMAKREFELDGHPEAMKPHIKKEFEDYMIFIERKYESISEKASKLAVPTLHEVKRLREVHGLPI
ncbi:Hypothetical protein D9617_25g061040 [Elsinoe fawcettii]|nr:Hypothetical protein D9617_25g061040 [Elsinoe fawcettii]